MFGFFKKKSAPEPKFIIANLNARTQPIHRGELFEDPLNKIISQKGLGEITGGGTLQAKSGEIENCDIEVQVNDLTARTIEAIRSSLEGLGAPKGSKLTTEPPTTTIDFGTLEGLAIYLNGTDLEDKVYEESDSNFVYSELDRLTQGKGKVYSYWQGTTETAFYLYGDSFLEMKLLISELVNNYPLCQKCRIEQVA